MGKREEEIRGLEKREEQQWNMNRGLEKREEDIRGMEKREEWNRAGLEKREEDIRGMEKREEQWGGRWSNKRRKQHGLEKRESRRPPFFRGFHGKRSVESAEQWSRGASEEVGGMAMDPPPVPGQ